MHVSSLHYGEQSCTPFYLCIWPPRRYIWESGADGNFAISEDTEGEPLGRGTEIRVYLKVRGDNLNFANAGPLQPHITLLQRGTN